MIGRWHHVADWAEVGGIFLLLALLGAVALIIAAALGIAMLVNTLVYAPAQAMGSLLGARR